MLYSLNGKYPTPIPEKIRLSDGSTRTDSSTFTAEEIAAAGYVAVDPKPNFTYPYYVTWSGTDWVVGEYSLEKVRQDQKQKVTDYRYNVEVNHPTIDTSRQGQAMINGAWSAAQIDPNILIDFKTKSGAWQQLDATYIQALAETVAEWVQQCFSREKALHQAIDAAVSQTDVMAIDIYTGWPTIDIIDIGASDA